MNPTIKQKWVAALRSGDYIQGQGALNSHGKFCCLGVLCDLHRKDTKGQWCASSVNQKILTYLGTADYLPREVVEWSGLRYCRPMVSTNHLDVLNDENTPFSKIAELIEKNF